MKFLASLTMALPIASVVAGPLRDPIIRSRAQSQLEIAKNKIAEGDFYPIHDPAANASEIESRVPGVVAGFALVVTGNMAADIVNSVVQQLGEYFFNHKQDQIWHNHEYCRTYFDTHGGGNCEIRTYERGTGDRTAVHHPEGGCAWPDAPDGSPDFNMFEDPGVGVYAVEMTATNAYTHGPNAEQCSSIEGICNPSYYFVRDEYIMVMQTWRLQGTVSQCQYSGGEDCGGICTSGVKEGDISGGSRWGGDCAIPCIDDDKLPERLLF